MTAAPTASSVRPSTNSVCDGDRGISTVLDVALALVLVTTSIGVIGIYLHEEQTAYEPDVAGQTAESLTGSTVSITISRSSARNTDAFPSEEFSENFDDPITDSDLRRVSHGSASGQLADAALASVEINGNVVTNVGESVEAGVAGPMLANLAGASRDAFVVATWEPYDGARISGAGTVGGPPPVDRDLSSATITVPSGLPELSDEEVAKAFRSDGRSGVATLVATAIVDGYLPPEDAQRALEGQGVERAMTVYRYERFAAGIGPSVDFVDSVDEESDISRLGADAESANEQLIAGLAAVIESDLEEPRDTELAADVDALTTQWQRGEITDEEWYGAVGREFGEAVSIHDVEITVQTWES